MTSASGGMLHRGADLDDAIALDENFAGLDHLAGFDVEQAGGVQHDGVRRGRVLTARWQSTGEAEPEETQRRGLGSHMGRDGNTRIG